MKGQVTLDIEKMPRSAFSIARGVRSPAARPRQGDAGILDHMVGVRVSRCLKGAQGR